MIIVGIAGGSASGKTKIAQKIAERFLNNVHIIKYDAYYLPFKEYSLEERKTFNYDHPETFDHQLLKEHLLMLEAGEKVATPIYDYVNYTRSAEVMMLQNPPILIIEGILTLFNPEIRELCDLKIYVDTDDDIRFIRRLHRDTKKRGRDLQSVSDQYLESVKVMHDLYVKPTKKYADIIIPIGADNHIAIEMVCAYIGSKWGV